MAFWGVEVRPGSHYTHLHDNAHGRLRICQAALGSGDAMTKTALHCVIGNRRPILLCNLIPNVVETCHLELEFEEDVKVIFSILGQRTVYLSGYFLHPKLLIGGDESGLYGEDIGEEDSSSYGNYDSDEDKYESDFIDHGNLEMVPPSPNYKSSVVIKELVEKDKPANGNTSQRCLKRKYVTSDSDNSNDDSRCQPVGKSKSSMDLENKEEDCFPISFILEKKNSAKTADGNSKLGDSAVYVILESEEEDGNAKPAEGNPGTGVVALDEEKKTKIDAISEDKESARRTSQPCDSSLLPSEMGFENNGIPKKKKNVKDERPLEMISDWERVSGDLEQDRDDIEVGEAKMETKEKDLLVGGHVNVAEKDEKLKKKKKDMAKKGKSCQMYTDFLTERTEEGVERDPNEFISTEVMDEVLPVGDKNSRKKTKKKKKKGVDTISLGKDGMQLENGRKTIEDKSLKNAWNVDEDLTVLDKSIPATPMSMTRRIFALDSLDATKTDWDIEVQVKQKGDLRLYNNSKGNGFVFDVILADKKDKQIRAVMFNKAARKFYPKFKLGKFYYISGGTIRPAKEQYKIADNDYEIILETGAIVKEVDDDSTPNAKSSFDKIDQGKVTSMEVPLSKITNDPTLSQGKAVYFNIKVYVTYISPDQTMWFWACKTCHKKVTESVDSGYWCEKCNGIVQCCLRCVMEVKISDHSGDAWVTVFNEVAENLIGCTAEELARIKASEGYDKYQLKLEKAIGTQHLFRVSVQHVEFMNKKRQKITVLAHAPADLANMLSS